ncbi:MAG: glycosyltransferase [Clostridia bacterium]|nr:glycosyltransferase [Clostridia bacterium]
MSVAVIVPVYNTEKYLKRCVDSILSQSFRDFVLLLVDDGSTDSSPLMCEAAAAADPRVQVMHQPNRGLSAARNTGIEEALRRGCEFITFIDSDDWVYSRYLELLVQAMAQDGCDAAVGRFITTDEEIPMDFFAPSEARLVMPEELYCRHVTMFTVAWGKLFRAKAFAALRFPEGRLYEDEFILWKLMFGYDKVALIDCPIYAYYVRPGSITNSAWSVKRLDALDAL